jgi:hypothetical protein
MNTPPSNWQLRRIGRIPDADAEQCQCGTKGHHLAAYRSEWAHVGTGEVKARFYCTNRAAALCGSLGVTFPPGYWKPT